MSRYSHLQAAPPRYRQLSKPQPKKSWYDNKYRTFEFANNLSYHSSSAAYKFELQQQRPDITEVMHVPGFHRPFNPLESACLQPSQLIR